MGYKVIVELDSALLEYIDFLACVRALPYSEVIRSILNEDYQQFKEKVKKDS